MLPADANPPCAQPAHVALFQSLIEHDQGKAPDSRFRRANIMAARDLCETKCAARAACLAGADANREGRDHGMRGGLMSYERVALGVGE